MQMVIKRENEMSTKVARELTQKQVDFSIVILLTDISYTNADKVKVVVKTGTRIVVNTHSNIGCAGGDDHFEVFPDQYELEHRYAC